MKRLLVSRIIAALFAVQLGSGCAFEVPTAPDPPAVSAIEPAEGTPGTEVTITGTGFGDSRSQVAVAFTGGTAEIRSVSPTRIVAVVPPKAATGPVTVYCRDASFRSLRFTVRPAPITSPPAREADTLELALTLEHIYGHRMFTRSGDPYDSMRVDLRGRYYGIGPGDLATTSDFRGDCLRAKIDRGRRVFTSVRYECWSYTSRALPGAAPFGYESDRTTIELWNVPYSELSDGTLMAILRGESIEAHLATYIYAHEYMAGAHYPLLMSTIERLFPCTAQSEVAIILRPID